MAKRYGWKPRRPIKDLALSNEVEALVMGFGETVLDSAQGDPNPEYVDSLQLRAFRSGGARGRVSANITASPLLGSRVEGKRGTLARAMASIGASTSPSNPGDPNELIQYTTRSGKKRTATRAQVDHWTRGR